jgi:hypothetical protein
MSDQLEPDENWVAALTFLRDLHARVTAIEERLSMLPTDAEVEDEIAASSEGDPWG